MYFLLLDRQNEYIHLLDYQWKRQLKDDQVKVTVACMQIVIVTAQQQPQPQQQNNHNCSWVETK